MPHDSKLQFWELETHHADDINTLCAQLGGRNVYGGGFWFDDEDALHEIAGPKARAELRLEDVIETLLRSRLTAEVEYSNDDVRGDVWEVGGRLRIPFGAGAYAAARKLPLTGQEKRMSERIERDTDIITTQSKAENVEDALTDVNFDRVAFVNDGGSITITSANAGGNSLIIAKGGTIVGPQTLQGNQTLQGGGSTTQVRGLKSGTVADFTAPGSRPTLFNNADSAVLTLLGSNTHVHGLDIEGAGAGSGFGTNSGIFFDSGLGNIFLMDTEISNTGGDGIRFFDNNMVTIADMEISNTGDRGIRGGSENTVSIADTEISETGSFGIDFGSFNTVTIADTQISNTDAHGIDFDSGNIVTIAGAQISDTGGHGINLSSDNIVTISGTQISDTDDFGINFSSDNMVTISGTQISDTGINGGIDHGINFGSDNIVTISGTQINDTSGDGIRFFDNNMVIIADTEISNTGVDGLHIIGTNNTVSLADSTFGDTFGDDVIDIDAAGNTLSGSGNVFDGTFGDQFCEVTGAQSGSFAFDQAPQPTCP